MNNILKISLFTLSVILSSNAMAATGAGHAQTELANPLTVTNEMDLDFGTIAIDPAAGPQTVSVDETYDISCPSTYVCESSAPSLGEISVEGAPDTIINISIVGKIQRT